MRNIIFSLILIQGIFCGSLGWGDGDNKDSFNGFAASYRNASPQEREAMIRNNPGFWQAYQSMFPSGGETGTPNDSSGGTTHAQSQLPPNDLGEVLGRLGEPTDPSNEASDPTDADGAGNPDAQGLSNAMEKIIQQMESTKDVSRALLTIKKFQDSEGANLTDAARGTLNRITEMLNARERELGDKKEPSTGKPSDATPTLQATNSSFVDPGGNRRIMKGPDGAQYALGEKPGTVWVKPPPGANGGEQAWQVFHLEGSGLIANPDKSLSVGPNYSPKALGFNLAPALHDNDGNVISTASYSNAAGDTTRRLADGSYGKTTREGEYTSSKTIPEGFSEIYQPTTNTAATTSSSDSQQWQWPGVGGFHFSNSVAASSASSEASPSRETASASPSGPTTKTSSGSVPGGGVPYSCNGPNCPRAQRLQPQKYIPYPIGPLQGTY